MAAIDRTAYPRFKRVVPARELAEAFTPTTAEVEWAREKTQKTVSSRILKGAAAGTHVGVVTDEANCILWFRNRWVRSEALSAVRAPGACQGDDAR